MTYRIGSQVKGAGSIVDAMSEYQGLRCMQVFLSGNITPVVKPLKEEDVKKALECMKICRFNIYVHSSYCINLGPPRDDPVVKKWSPVLKETLIQAQRINAGTILHMGSGCESRGAVGTPENFHSNVTEILGDFPVTRKPIVLIENMCGSGSRLGCTWDQIRSVYECFNDQRVGFCFDTCHAFSAGISKFATHEDVVSVFEESDSIQKIDMIHLNDSLEPFHSKKDKHGAIGTTIWKSRESQDDGLMTLLEISKERGIDLILETPSPADDLKTLREIIKRNKN